MASLQDSNDSLVEKNRKFFDDASTHIFTEPWIRDLQSQISTHLRSNLEWLGITLDDQYPEGKPREPMKLLDYACGNGILSQTLAPHFSTCIGMDVSEGMIATYNGAAQNLKLFPDHMRAVHGDLMAPEVDPALLSEEFSDFDLVVISMALHHLQDIGEAVKRLANRLRTGGTLLVIDWAAVEQPTQKDEESVKSTNDQSDKRQQRAHQHRDHQNGHGDFNHPAAHTMAHHDFSREQMEAAFKDAGSKDFDFVLHKELSSVPMVKGEMRLFFAKGRKIRQY